VQYSNVAKNLEELNKKITEDPLLGEDYQIGHAYCMKLDKYKNLKEKPYMKIIWEKHISPILEEYYRGTDEVQNKKIETLKDTFTSILKKTETETQDTK
jgi:5-methylcytosine-specific restriction protein B